jgi:ribonuclease HI/ADP-ribose pyrophosphatase YjhB (NUDIX family)
MNTDESLTIFVNGILHNNKQEILLLRRPATDHFLPNYYELPGGKLEPKETFEVALRRKFWQELSLHVKISNYFTSVADENRHGPYLRVFFEVVSETSDTSIMPKLDSSHDNYIWFNGVKGDHKIAPDTNRVLNLEEDAEAESRAVSAPPNEPNYNVLIIYTDGGSRGNPGPSASGFVIMDGQERIVERGGKYLGVTTNNQAEYQAVRMALEAALKYHPRQIQFRLDSLMVVNQMNGIYKVKNKDLWPVHETIRHLIQNFKRVDFHHVPREYNRLADGEVNRVLDAEEQLR